jgi:hypothetical protein
MDFNNLCHSYVLSFGRCLRNTALAMLLQHLIFTSAMLCIKHMWSVEVTSLGTYPLRGVPLRYLVVFSMFSTTSCARNIGRDS